VSNDAEGQARNTAIRIETRFGVGAFQGALKQLGWIEGQNT
jgi:hypothetical protein